MTDRICKVPDCDRPIQARGFCHGHYSRIARGVDPFAPMRKRPARQQEDTIAQRLMENTETNDLGCILRTTSLGEQGYGFIYWVRYGKSVRAHRAAWEIVNGPIPGALTVDHLCRNPSCVNVEHMELVTAAENALRGSGRHVSAANKRARTHCKHGHQWTPANIFRSGDGYRRCRTCAALYQRRIAPARNVRRNAARKATREAQ